MIFLKYFKYPPPKGLEQKKNKEWFKMSTITKNVIVINQWKFGVNKCLSAIA